MKVVAVIFNSALRALSTSCSYRIKMAWCFKSTHLATYSSYIVVDIIVDIVFYCLLPFWFPHKLHTMHIGCTVPLAFSGRPVPTDVTPSHNQTTPPSVFMYVAT